MGAQGRQAADRARGQAAALEAPGLPRQWRTAPASLACGRRHRPSLAKMWTLRIVVGDKRRRPLVWAARPNVTPCEGTGARAREASEESVRSRAKESLGDGGARGEERCFAHRSKRQDHLCPGRGLPSIADTRAGWRNAEARRGLAVGTRSTPAALRVPQDRPARRGGHRNGQRPRECGSRSGARRRRRHRGSVGGSS